MCLLPCSVLGHQWLSSLAPLRPVAWSYSSAHLPVLGHQWFSSLAPLRPVARSYSSAHLPALLRSLTGSVNSCWSWWLCFQSWECVSELCNQEQNTSLGFSSHFRENLEIECKLQLENLSQGTSIFFLLGKKVIFPRETAFSGLL